MSMPDPLILESGEKDAAIAVVSGQYRVADITVGVGRQRAAISKSDPAIGRARESREFVGPAGVRSGIVVPNDDRIAKGDDRRFALSEVGRASAAGIIVRQSV